METGIFVSHIVWLIRTRKIRKEAAAHGKNFDDIALERKQQGIPFKFADRKTRKESKAEDVEQGVVEPVGEQARSDDTAGQSPPADDGPVLKKHVRCRPEESNAKGL